MNQIVVAVDFSKSSIHALDFAISIANNIGADIHMIWVDKPTSSDSLYNEAPSQTRQEVINRFNNLIEDSKKSFTKGKLSYKLRKGKIYNEISSQAKLLKADFIVAGAHGVSGFEEYWIGSNSYKIVTSASCPVITIRSDFQFKDKLKKIVLPFDHTNETLLKVPFTTKFAKYFNPEIHLVGIYSTPLKTIQKKIDNNIEKVNQQLKAEKFKVHIEKIDSNTITNSIINYAEKINADLITIMTEQQKATTTMLGPYAQQIVNYSSVPIMSIQEF